MGKNKKWIDTMVEKANDKCFKCEKFYQNCESETECHGDENACHEFKGMVIAAREVK